VSRVTRRPTLIEEEREKLFPEEDELGPATVFHVHAGYRRVLAGFLREIEFNFKDGINTHYATWRAIYLQMVLDCFAEELIAKGQGKTSGLFRSQALNPLLQRQLRGIDDHETRHIKYSVGHTPDDAASFYLKDDPLDPRNIGRVLRNILYIWSIRLSLGMLGTKLREEGYWKAYENNQELWRWRNGLEEGAWNEVGPLSTMEIGVLGYEGLGDFYRDLIDSSVSSNSVSEIPTHSRLSPRESWISTARR